MSAIQNGTYLDQQVFPAPTWCVPGVLPEGCCILSGTPKVGKSFLVLAIALAAAEGGNVLGVEVEQRPVLYLALEDTPRRLQLRSRILLEDKSLPVEFNYLTNDDAAGALDTAKPWVKANWQRKPLVIVDTLETVRNPDRTQNSYSDDYKVGALLRSVLAPGGTVVAVHHNRKGESEDFLESVSGTLGLVGSVDTIITLSRKRAEAGGVLAVTGRDVDETIYKLNFENGFWSPAGSDLGEAAQRAKTRNLGGNMQQALDLINERQATTSREVAEYLGIAEPTARKYLSRLCTDYGLIERTGPGAYGPVTESQLSQDEQSASTLPASA